MSETDDITVRLDNLAQSLANGYPRSPHTLVDLAEAASLIMRLRYERDVWREKAGMYHGQTILADTARMEERKECERLIEDFESGPTVKDYEDGYNAAKAEIIAAIRSRPLPNTQKEGT